MSKKESVNIWVEGANDALDSAYKLVESKKYHHALFFLHLALEKILKALYISTKDEAPPYIHNLKQIAQHAGFELNEEELLQLDEISEFNVSARYDEYKYKIYKRATKEYTEKWMKIGEDLYNRFKNLI
jgi:HEPN domain-containing protein